ncbi:unnamed protein product [Rotaria magnacalcarata]|uniref:MD-2-related lipid-recognition domain-containing protein n=1 Tax=Rotaria magnacalcarata TaxID=392030 RepID=A0A820EUP8_9BILA|nr:unnamed protein product [Rotaria magnacalcarata]CAF4254010.1 unnamed protein product [Rotaria magnacalcarata]
MYSICILVLLSCSFNNVWAATPYQACDSAFGTIQTFDVTGCTTSPCKFTKGNSYAMNLTFQSKAPSNSVKVSIHGVISGIPIPFPLPDPDACKLGIACPVNEHDVYTASLALDVLSSYPSLSLYVKIELVSGEKVQDYACLRFPATITSSKNELDNLVGWKKGKIFEILYQKIAQLDLKPLNHSFRSLTYMLY